MRLHNVDNVKTDKPSVISAVQVKRLAHKGCKTFLLAHLQTFEEADPNGDYMSTYPVFSGIETSQALESLWSHKCMKR